MTGHDASSASREDEPAGAVAAVMRFARRGLEAASDLVLPPSCLACRAPLAAHDALCPECWRGIEFIRPPLCDRLGLPMPFDTGGTMVSAAAVADPPTYDRARAVACYAGVMRDLIRGLKFHDRHDARRLFGRWLAEAGSDLIGDAEIVVPVPLGRWRLIMRRFNQAAILAREIAARTHLAYEPMVLVRTRATRAQVGLTRLQRRDNVAGAFAVPASQAPLIRAKRVLLVDDVVTTGATVGACAAALKRAGAARVDVLALAIVADMALIPA
jgi:ComF family protein